MNGLGRKNKTEKNKSEIFTPETLGIVLVIFATLSLVCMITRRSVFGELGEAIACFVLGMFGYLGFLLEGYLFILGGRLLFGKKSPFSKKTRIISSFAFLMIAMFLHVIISKAPYSSCFGENGYVSLSYNSGVDSHVFSVGGGVLGLISFLFLTILSKVGTLVVSAIMAGLSIYSLIKIYKSEGIFYKHKSEKFRGSYIVHDGNETTETPSNALSAEKSEPVTDTQSLEDDFGEVKEEKTSQKLFINDGPSFLFKTKREMLKDDQNSALKIDMTSGGLGLGRAGLSYQEQYSNELRDKIDYIKTPSMLRVDKPIQNTNTVVSEEVKDIKKDIKEIENQLVKPVENISKQPENNIPIIEHDENEGLDEDVDDAKAHADLFSKYANVSENNVEPETDDVYRTVTQTEEIKEDKEANDLFKKFLEDNGRNSSAETEQNVVKENEDFSANGNRFKSQTDTEFSDYGNYGTGSEKTDVENERSETENFGDETENEIKESFEDSLFGVNKNENSYQEENAEEPPVSVLDNDRVKDIFSNENQVEENTENGNEVEIFDTKESLFKETDSYTQPKSESVILKANEIISENKKEEPKKEKEKPPVGRKYYKPSIDLLADYESQSTEAEDHEGRMAIIKQTLEDFHINAEPVSYVQGPTVTRYEVMMPAGVSVKKVLTLDDDLRMRLASKNGVRIEAPIPGKNLVGIEVANKCPVTVGLKEIIKHIEEKPKKGKLEFAIGKDIVGNSVTDDLSKGPHFLVAGTTGSGKSVCLNIMIVSLIMRYSPEELRLVLVDPKGNEFIPYEHIPHLMIDEIITQPKKALAALAWAQEEMERRYLMLKEVGGARDIDSYNERIDKDTPRMARVVFIVDELSNLMETCKREMEARILSIAQKARAVGIHMVLATQRPSVDIITGTIKGNLPSRIALKVTSFADSSTILGQGGAEKLLGYGDMLYKNSSMGETERYQGAWITDNEIYSVVEYIKENNKAYFDDEMQEYLEKEMRGNVEEETQQPDGEQGGEEEFDDIFIRSLALGVISKSLSISQLQRRFQMGYPRAGSLIDKMERYNFISGNEGSKARRVLMTREEFEKKFGGTPESFNY